MIHIPDIVKTTCRKCGANISPGYDFCLSCGTKFSEIPPNTADRDSWWGDMPPSKRNLYESIFAIFGIIIFVMILLIIYLPVFFTPR